MKNLAGFISLTTVLSLCLLPSPRAVADSPQPPREGTEILLSGTQLSEIADWAKNSKIDLEELLEVSKSLSYSVAKSRLFKGVDEVLAASSPKSTELLMRYALNRALKINNDILEKRIILTRPGVIDQQVRLFLRSIEMSLRYYESDMAVISNPTAKSTINLVALPYAQFGLESAELLMSINESILDARTQYEIARTVLAFFANDLKKDQHWVGYAPAIDRIVRFLKQTEGTNNLETAQILSDMRDLRRVFFKAVELVRSQMKLPPRTSGGSQATPSLSRSVDNSKIYNCQDLQDKNAPVGTKCKTTIGKLFMRVDRPNLLEAWKMCDTDDCKKGYVISGVIERGRGYFDSVRICGRLGAVIPDPDKFLEAIDYRIYEVLPNLTENSWFHILYVDSYFDFFRRYVGRAKSIEKSYADQTFGTGDVRCALSE